MSADPVTKVLIVGGGTAGWMAASALSKLMGTHIQFTVVESDDIGIIGVGEATIPYIKTHNTLLGIDEVEFVRETQGTFKLGIEFVDWGKKGDAYIHGFGTLGFDVDTHPFHHFWTRARLKGIGGDLSRYSFNVLACRANKFMATPTDAPKNSPLADISYAYHFDASLYARYLRTVSERAGVKRVEGKVVEVVQDPENGFVRSVKLARGEELSADFFIDCTGFRGLLISETLKSPYCDWTKWLPCDRAMAVPCSNVEPPIPYTRSTAKSAGWQWRIPLQHRVGNGYVYSSAYVSDDDARKELLAGIDGKPLAEPRIIPYTAGFRPEPWRKNVVAIGLSGGFLEPLESTAIHLIQIGIAKLALSFPRKDMSPHLQRLYNKQIAFEFENIRDFLVLHYRASTRDDTPFWADWRTREIPDSLQETMDLFRESARIYPKSDNLFSVPSWVQVMIGQGIVPQDYPPVINTFPEKDLEPFLNQVEAVIQSNIKVMPSHEQFIDRFCRAKPM